MSARRKAQYITVPSPLNFTVQGYANSGALGILFLFSLFKFSYSFNLNKFNLRQILRKKRRTLSLIEQHRASQKLFFNITNKQFFINAKNIGFYFANDGEISPAKLFLLAHKKNKKCFFPKLTQNDKMEFRLFSNKQNLKANKYGIQEPTLNCPTIDSHMLDLVFVPLVGFDKNGNRLGMGGGYYDRTFSFRKKIRGKPILVGLAHNCQEVDRLDTENWDVAMDFIATDKMLIRVCQPNHATAIFTIAGRGPTPSTTAYLETLPC
eukprot:TRINITY_DN4574_c0_g3_i1.p1 TRINITY_DN4574_c0_g3~~TRINITY_DN4574_c0_g3_i1.p1  ORF type:complete len:265 (+),score=-1.19 TRINITY_DN4574_c0_g3_i1:145-939(+)